MVTIKNWSEECQLRDLRHRIDKSNGRLELSWQYAGAEHFIVAVRSRFNVTENWGEKMRQTLMENFPHILEATDGYSCGTANGTCFYHISALEFKGRGMAFSIPYRGTEPLECRVLLCRREKEDWEVYVPDQMSLAAGSGNSVRAPYIILYKLTEKKLDRFLFWRRRRCTLNIGKFKGYTDGLLYYIVSGGNVRYPLSCEILGQPVEISLPRNVELNLYVREEYRGYYIIKSY